MLLTDPKAAAIQRIHGTMERPVKKEYSAELRNPKNVMKGSDTPIILRSGVTSKVPIARIKFAAALNVE